MRWPWIEAEFGTQNALDYLIGEKFLNFLQAAETDAEFRAEIPEFVGGIKSIYGVLVARIKQGVFRSSWLTSARHYSEEVPSSGGHLLRLFSCLQFSCLF